MVRIKAYVLSAGVVWITACVSNVTVPTPKLDHPANPRAEPAPISSSPFVLKKEQSPEDTSSGMEHMEGMGEMKGMKGIHHHGH
jgi:hypothetical protein